MNSANRHLKTLLKPTLALSFLLFLAACGGGGGGGAGSEAPAPAPIPNPDLSTRNFAPAPVGARWFYQNVDASTSATLAVTNRVTSTRAVEGGTASVLQSSDPQEAEILLLEDSTGVRQFPGSNADPLTVAAGPIQLLRYPLRLGDSFVTLDRNVGAVIDFDGDRLVDAASIRAETQVVGLESIDTPAGRLVDCLHTRVTGVVTVQSSVLKRAITVNSVTDEWRAPGVGLVRSENSVSSEGVSSKNSQMITAYGVGSTRSESVAPTATAAGLSTGLPLGPGSSVEIAFSEAMDTSSLQTALTVLDAAGQVVAGNVSVTERDLKFVPSSPWLSGNYIAKLSTAAQDLVGNALSAAQQWSFVVDVNQPTLLSSQPATGAVDVGLDSALTLVFSEAVDVASVNAFTIRLRAGVAGELAVHYVVSGSQVTVTPDTALPRGSEIEVDIEGVKDLAGNSVSAVRLRFSTDVGRFRVSQTLSDPANVRTLSAPLATGDLNGDGRADIAISASRFDGSRWSQGVMVFKQSSEGQLGSAYLVGEDDACEIKSLAIGDMNGDGRNDLVILRPGCGIDIFTQAADGQLQAPTRIADTSGTVMVLGNTHGGSQLDIVTFNSDAQIVRVWVLIAGTWILHDQLSVPGVSGHRAELAIGDLNGDGRNDVALTASGLPGMATAGLLYQTQDGHLAQPVWLKTGDLAGAYIGLTIGDVNGDGRLDLLAISTSYSSVYVFTQGADGQLKETQRLTEFGGDIVTLVDVNLDGRLDMVTRGTNLRVRLQSADGSWLPAAEYQSGNEGFYSNALAFGDVNGDGRVDVISGTKVLLQRVVPTMAASRPPSSLGQRMRAGVRAVVDAKLRQ